MRFFDYFFLGLIIPIHHIYGLSTSGTIILQSSC